MHVALQHQKVSKLDYGCGLTFCTDGGFEIRIEADYALTKSRTTTIHSPEPFSDNSGPLDSLREEINATSTAEKDGILVLTSADGLSLRVAPSADFEAWALAGPRGQKIVCLPGGELAVWEAETS